MDTEATAEHVLRLSAADGQTWFITAPRGEELDDDLPWVFDAREEPPRFLRQGAGSVATNEALVAIPSDWIALPTDDRTATPAGRLYLPMKQLFRVRGNVHFSSNQDSIRRIRTGRAEAKEESYEWSGKRLWQDFIRPGEVAPPNCTVR